MTARVLEVRRAQSDGINPRRDDDDDADDEMSLTPSTRWPVTIDSSIPLPHNHRGLRQLRTQ